MMGAIGRALAQAGRQAAPPHGMALSDDFAGPLALGSKWTFFRPAPDEAQRIRVEGRLTSAARGRAPSSGSPLLISTGDLAYLLNARSRSIRAPRRALCCSMMTSSMPGLADEKHFVTHHDGIERGAPGQPYGARMMMRVTNRRHIVAIHTSGDGGAHMETL
jgi:hypothetical protein